MINRVTLLGHVGAEPEIRSTKSGASICNLRVATTESRKAKSGEWEKVTEWHRVIVFGTTADNVGRFVEKGSKIYIDGKIKTSKFTDKNGIERYSTDIIANEVRFLGKSEAREEGGTQRAKPSQKAAPATQAADDYGSGWGGQSSETNWDDDIPF